MMHEAGLYLSRSHLAFSTHIFAGELLFTILDTAELLGCHEVILPAHRHSGWPRHFSGGLAARLARSTRSTTILLANHEGVSSPVLRLSQNGLDVLLYHGHAHDDANYYPV